MQISKRADGRGHWPKGKPRRRRGVDASAFIRALRKEFGLSRLAEAAGCHHCTVRQWMEGRDWPTLERLETIVDRLFPVVLRSGSLPIKGCVLYLGVGQYTRQSSRGGEADGRGDD
jgi:transcriptional regulator with XRE-family HTH domain